MFSELLASQYECNFSSGSCRYAVRSWATGAHFLSRLLQSLLKVPHPTWLHWLLVWYYVCWSLCFVDHRKCFLSFHSKARGDRLGSIDKGDPVQYRVAVSFALHWWCERKLVQEIQRIQRGEFQAGALQGGIVALFFYFSPAHHHCKDKNDFGMYIAKEQLWQNETHCQSGLFIIFPHSPQKYHLIENYAPPTPMILCVVKLRAAFFSESLWDRAPSGEKTSRIKSVSYCHHAIMFCTNIFCQRWGSEQRNTKSMKNSSPSQISSKFGFKCFQNLSCQASEVKK